MTLRILDTISSSIGDSLSINQLTKRIKDRYGSAYYANIYQKLQELKDKGYLNLELTGNSYIIKLNFENYLLIDKLAELEIEKKISFLSNRPNLFSFFTDIEKALADPCLISSVSSIKTSKNIKLNKIEFMFLLKESSDYIHETTKLFETMLNIQRKHNLKIDNLILDYDDFFDLITSDEINPAREALSEKISLFYPQAFWTEIKSIAEKNQIKAIKSETKPLTISDSDLAFNLNRFGYKEYGSSFEKGKKICIEYIITSLLLREDARGLDAISVILEKNNFKINLLSFLSQKYETAPRLSGILKALQQIKPKAEIDKTIQILQLFSKEEIPADKASIQQKLELYNVL